MLVLVAPLRLADFGVLLLDGLRLPLDFSRELVALLTKGHRRRLGLVAPARHGAAAMDDFAVERDDLG